jgi:hypothetical protein
MSSKDAQTLAAILPVVDEAMRAGVPVHLRRLTIESAQSSSVFRDLGLPGLVSDEDDILYVYVEGFAKHGGVSLFYSPKRDAVDIIGRYGRLTTIDSYIEDKAQELAFCYYSELQAYADRGFEVDSRWVPVLLKRGIIKAKTTTTYVPA